MEERLKLKTLKDIIFKEYTRLHYYRRKNDPKGKDFADRVGYASEIILPDELRAVAVKRVKYYRERIKFIGMADWATKGRIFELIEFFNLTKEDLR